MWRVASFRGSFLVSLPVPPFPHTSLPAVQFSVCRVLYTIGDTMKGKILSLFVLLALCAKLVASQSPTDQAALTALMTLGEPYIGLGWNGDVATACTDPWAGLTCEGGVITELCVDVCLDVSFHLLKKF